jgi:hypothetical protein
MFSCDCTARIRSVLEGFILKAEDQRNIILQKCVTIFYIVYSCVDMCHLEYEPSNVPGVNFNFCFQFSHRDSILSENAHDRESR